MQALFWSENQGLSGRLPSDVEIRQIQQDDLRPVAFDLLQVRHEVKWAHGGQLEDRKVCVLRRIFLVDRIGLTRPHSQIAGGRGERLQRLDSFPERAVLPPTDALRVGTVGDAGQRGFELLGAVSRGDRRAQAAEMS